MQVTVTLPDEFAASLVPDGRDASRLLLEEATAAAYRARRLSAEQVKLILGLATQQDVDIFLGSHAIYDYTVSDLDNDLAVIDRVAAPAA